MVATAALKRLGAQLAESLSPHGDLLDLLLSPFKAPHRPIDRKIDHSPPGHRHRPESRASFAYLPYFAGISRTRATQAIRLGRAAKGQCAEAFVESVDAGGDSAGSALSAQHCAVRQLLDLACEMAATGGSTADAVQGMTPRAKKRFSQAFGALTMHEIRGHTTAVRAELSRAMAQLGIPATQHLVLQSCGISDAGHGQERLKAVLGFAAAWGAQPGIGDLAAMPSDPLDFAWQMVHMAGKALHVPDAGLPTVTLQPPHDAALATLHGPTSVLSVQPASRSDMACAIFHEMVHNTQDQWIKMLELDDDALPAHQRDFATLARISKAGIPPTHPHAHRWQSQCERDAWASEQMLLIALAGEARLSGAFSPVVKAIPLDPCCIDDVHDRVATQIGLCIDQPLPQSVGTRQWRQLLQAVSGLELSLIGPERRLWFDVIATRAGLLLQPSPKHAHALLTALAGAASPQSRGFLLTPQHGERR
jgi:hypothetical protein